MNYETVLLPLCHRAAILKAYKGEFKVCMLAKKPRGISMTQAMNLRARWVCGESASSMAHHFKNRRDSVLRLLAGISFVSPSEKEQEGFHPLVARFYDALDRCVFGPPDALDETAQVTPLKLFRRGTDEAGLRAPKPGSAMDEYLGLPAEHRPTIGVTFKEGILVVSKVAACGPGRRAEIRPDELVLEVDREAVVTHDDLARALMKGTIGREAHLVVANDKGTRRRVAVELISKQELDQREAEAAERKEHKDAQRAQFEDDEEDLDDLMA